uniref:(northern house mosquito) hypothetical protein n=1 Tax=Culex pipiens TaxID=7175 RepID=A0A8D8CB57_CULPI
MAEEAVPACSTFVSSYRVPLVESYQLIRFRNVERARCVTLQLVGPRSVPRVVLDIWRHRAAQQPYRAGNYEQTMTTTTTMGTCFIRRRSEVYKQNAESYRTRGESGDRERGEDSR